MLQLKVVQPSTCDGANANLGCKIWLEYDDQDPPDNVVYTPVNIERRCARHAALTHPSLAQVFADAYGDDVRRNRILGRIEQAFPAWYDAENGVLVNGGNVTIDAGGTLRLKCPSGVGFAAKSALQTWCNANIGIGKVVVS